MPRHVVVLEGAYGFIEDILYSLGDAEDWVHRNQADFGSWADDVAMGLMSAQEMKRRMNEQFANGIKQLGEARALASANGRRMGFSHLHETLRDLQAPTVAGIRLVLPLSQDGA